MRYTLHSVQYVRVQDVQEQYYVHQYSKKRIKMAEEVPREDARFVLSSFFCLVPSGPVKLFWVLGSGFWVLGSGLIFSFHVHVHVLLLRSLRRLLLLGSKQNAKSAKFSY